MLHKSNKNETLRAYLIQYFARHPHTCQIKGERMLTAARLADAEIRGAAFGIRCEWEPETAPLAGQFSDPEREREAIEAVNDGRWSYDTLLCYGPDGSVLSILGCVLIANDRTERHVRRCYEADLMAEALAEHGLGV